jgi:hypothetical protein
MFKLLISQIADHYNKLPVSVKIAWILMIIVLIIGFMIWAVIDIGSMLVFSGMAITGASIATLVTHYTEND